jgi:hypothetical protein
MLKIKTEGTAPCLIAGIQPEIVLAIMIADQLWSRKFSTHDFVITCVTDSHKENLESLHNFGMAFDMRTRQLEEWQKSQFAVELQALLGSEYDVVLEKTHIHVEFDNK